MSDCYLTHSGQYRPWIVYRYSLRAFDTQAEAEEWERRVIERWATITATDNKPEPNYQFTP